MALYEQFRISPRGLDPTHSLHVVKQCEEQIAKKTDDLHLDLSTLAAILSGIGVRYYLLDDLVNARAFGERSLTTISEYFFGDWRLHTRTDEGTVDPAWWHGNEAWMELWRSALLWGSALPEWDILSRLALYPDHQRAVSEIDATPALRTLYVEIARHLRGEAVDDASGKVIKQEGANHRSTGQLAGLLDAIILRKRESATVMVNELLVQHSRRKRSSDVLDTVSIEGTFMIHLARCNGLELKVDDGVDIYRMNLR